jgi:hypothetical protein
MIPVTNQPKKNTTMVEPFAASISVAMMNETKLSWKHLWKGLAKGAVAGVNLII